MTKISANKAAAEVRHEILRKMNALEKQFPEFDRATLWEKLRRYIKGMARRASAKKGGLGRQ